MATINIKDYKIGFSDRFFFDTNVWLLLYGTIANYQLKEQIKYTELFQKLITKGSPIYTSSMVVSEFANVLLRRDFKQWVSNEKLVNMDFKTDFVGSQDYEKSVETIKSSLNNIFKLPNLLLVSVNFNTIDKSAILQNFKLVDFNDSYICQLAIINKCRIVTNDKDFFKLSADVDILTALL